MLFRRELDLPTSATRAIAQVCADSRYRLTVNGERVGWGPAPADPRWPEVDELDILPFLKPGRNVLGSEVLYYGGGDGTYVLGKPGFIFRISLSLADGTSTEVVSDTSWHARIDRAHPPGYHRRWYLRALQEQFDAREHPWGWDQPGHEPDSSWLPAMLLEAQPDKPAATGGYPEFTWDMAMDGRGERAALRSREIPEMKERLIPAMRLAETGTVTWHRNPDDWFQSRVPGSFSITTHTVENTTPAGVTLDPGSPAGGAFATFEWQEQGVGWPVVVLDAPEGTVIELMTQEAHDPANTSWLDSQFYAWSRFICREGENRIEPFDFESLRWLQIHVCSRNL